MQNTLLLIELKLGKVKTHVVCGLKTPTYRRAALLVFFKSTYHAQHPSQYDYDRFR
jgi:hypothetical protein